ncbi:hypothetical protein FM106_17975 [Brachybacterium faecium]|nr:hypothetical protein FM106_17975 [Brachybacterium faecium]
MHPGAPGHLSGSRDPAGLRSAARAATSGPTKVLRTAPNRFYRMSEATRAREDREHSS